MDKVNRFFRYLYDPEPMNDSIEPIVCLARTYVDDTPRGSGGTHPPWPEDFMRDHEARIWLTYRTGFEKIMRDTKDTSLAVKLGSGGFTADTGFGCMIRSAQTLLANTILILRYGREWRRDGDRPSEASILRLFADHADAPYSIHRFIDHGARACDKPAGQWFGPNAASLCISALTLDYEASDVRVYVASEQGGTIYEDAALQIAKVDGTFKPLLILVPQRLGHERINPIYHEAIRSLFDVPQFMGIAGGRPSSAHYFFARQSEKLFFLDPHFPRASFPYHQNLGDYTQEDLDSVHTSRVRAVSMGDMDPSMLIGFLIKSEADWDAWKKGMNDQPGHGRLATIEATKPLFSERERDQELELASDVLSDEEGLQ